MIGQGREIDIRGEEGICSPNFYTWKMRFKNWRYPTPFETIKTNIYKNKLGSKRDDDDNDTDDDDTNEDDDTYPIFRELLKVESHRGTTLLQVTAGHGSIPAVTSVRSKVACPLFEGVQGRLVRKHENFWLVCIATNDALPLLE